MSINACTIDCSQMNNICYQRRAQIIATLPPYVPTRGTTIVPKPRSLGVDFFRRRDQDINEETIILEQPIIAVSIEFAGETFMESIERGDENFRPLINVYGITLGHSIAESVNISDVEIKIL
jgi:hypothetical protein